MASGKVEGELWGGRARDWAELGEPLGKPLFAAMLDAAKVGNGATMLDMGCGAGLACMMALERGALPTGLDASANLLEIARERIPDREFKQGDIEELPFDDDTFDVVFAANSVQFADDQQKAVREALRVKKPNGKFVIGMWCELERCDMSHVFRALSPGGPPPNAPPTLAVRENLHALLEQAGCTILDEGEVLCPFEFASAAEVLRGCRSAGVIQMFEDKMGEEHVIRAITDAHEPFRRPDGSYRSDNWFRWVLCS